MQTRLPYFVTIAALIAATLTACTSGEGPHAPSSTSAHSSTSRRDCSIKIEKSGLSFREKSPTGLPYPKNERPISYAYLLHNPCNLAASYIMMKIHFIDKSTNIIRFPSGKPIQDNNSLHSLLPRQTIGLAGSFQIANALELVNSRIVKNIKVDIVSIDWRKSSEVKNSVAASATNVRVGPRDRHHNAFIEFSVSQRSKVSSTRADVYVVLSDHTGRIVGGGIGEIILQKHSQRRLSVETWVPPIPGLIASAYLLRQDI